MMFINNILEKTTDHSAAIVLFEFSCYINYFLARVV